jgi:hypothetical protein
MKYLFSSIEVIVLFIDELDLYYIFSLLEIGRLWKLKVSVRAISYRALLLCC